MVLVVLIVIIAVVWLLIAQPWSGAATETEKVQPAASASPRQTALSLPVPAAHTPEPAPSAAPSATAPAPTATAPAPAPSGTEAAIPTCANDDLLVEPVLDKESYRSGEKPKLSIALTNSGDVDCTLNVGTSTQKFVIASGSDIWWRSTDCQSKPSDQIVLLAAGQRVTSAAPLEWDRTRSSVKTCEADRPAATGGGASYHLTVEIAGVESDGSAQFLLY